MNPVLRISVLPALEQECPNWVSDVVGVYEQSHGGKKMNELRALINGRILVHKFAKAPFATLQWMSDTASSLLECLDISKERRQRSQRISRRYQSEVWMRPCLCALPTALVGRATVPKARCCWRYRTEKHC